MSIGSFRGFQQGVVNQINNLKEQHVSSVQRISSGRRINSYGDDIGGLSVSSRMNTDRISTAQARRNVGEAISIMELSGAGINEVVQLLSRGRELAVQSANATQDSQTRTAMQKELAEILTQIDNIANTTTYNGKKYLAAGSLSSSTVHTQSNGGFISADGQTTVDNTVHSSTSSSVSASDITDVKTALSTNWLGNAEAMIEQYYGIKGQGDTMEFDISSDGATTSALASVTVYYTLSGTTPTVTKQLMTIDLDHSDYFLPAGANSDGGTGGTPMKYGDRIVAHEMVHAVTNSATNFYNMPGWFKEGTAEFIHGADYRLDVADGSYDNQLSATGLANAISEIPTTASPSSSNGYAGSYLAVRYMHEQLKDGGNGMKDFFEWMAADTTRTFDDAINNFSSQLGATNNADYISNVKTALSSLDLTTGSGTLSVGSNTLSIDLANNDTGAIGGSDADGGSEKTPTGVVSNSSSTPEDFSYDSDVVSSSSSGGSSGSSSSSGVSFQIGIGSSSQFNVASLLADLRTSELGINSLDISSENGAKGALATLTSVLDTVLTQQAKVGSAHTRLLSISDSFARNEMTLEMSGGKIDSVDMATESANSVRSQLLLQSGVFAMQTANLSQSRLIGLIG